MPERRKTREELRQEALGNQTPESDERVELPFEALTDEEHTEANELFELLHKSGYETAGSYQIGTDGPEDPTLVTLSVILPSTNQWDPSVAYENEGNDA